MHRFLHEKAVSAYALQTPALLYFAFYLRILSIAAAHNLGQSYKTPLSLKVSYQFRILDIAEIAGGLRGM